jgi:16S rRNA G527 N7-methylase RsmG
MTDPLTLVLHEIQRRGGIGRGNVAAEIAHAEQFAAAGGHPATVVDLGSGGGLPGLVVAMRCPDAAVTLIERRAKRADLLRYGIHALGIGDRVRVVERDVVDVIDDHPDLVDLVTARSFGPPQMVARCAAPLLHAGGLLVVSEPPGSVERWDGDSMAALGFSDSVRLGGVRRLVRAEGA